MGATAQAARCTVIGIGETAHRRQWPGMAFALQVEAAAPLPVRKAAP